MEKCKNGTETTSKTQKIEILRKEAQIEKGVWNFLNKVCKRQINAHVFIY